jgi:hypothetical protein
MDTVRLRENATDAIRYWERRPAYNVVLALIVLVYFVLALPSSKTLLSVDLVLTLFVLAVVANVAYCAAYVPDVFAQMSGFQEQWRKYRWTMFAIGVAFASVLARFVSIGLFYSVSH